MTATARTRRKEGAMKAAAAARAPAQPLRRKPTHMTTWAASGPGMVWPSATPSRNSVSLSQPRRSTRSRCMYPTLAIGPPNPHVPRPRKYRRNAPNPGAAPGPAPSVRSSASVLIFAAAGPAAGCAALRPGVGLCIGCFLSGGCAAAEHGVEAVSVDAVEDRAGQVQDAGVAADHGQAAQDDVQALGFGRLVALVVQIGFVTQ